MITMKKSQILTYALVICLLAAAAYAWFIARSSGSGFSFANADKYTAGDITVNDTVDELDLDWTSGKVNVEYHAGSGITVSETANLALDDSTRLRWWLDGKTLRIRYCKPGLNLNFNLQKVLTISLPEGLKLDKAELRVTSAEMNIPVLAADEIVLASTSGNVKAVTSARKLKADSTSGSLDIRQDGRLEKAEITSTSGGILAELAEAEEITVHSTSGIISLKAGKTDKAKLSSTSGNITLRLGAFRKLEAGSTSGRISAFLPTEPGFTCETSQTSGDFYSDLALVTSGNTYTCGDGSAKCSLHTTSGNIELKKAE